MPSMEHISSVSIGRYGQIVERLREAVEKSSKSSFIIGDGALEVARCRITAAGTVRVTSASTTREWRFLPLC
ncbi:MULTISPECIES: hypothetical protein [unclassified Streptomyces]|uniref:hypothetical protein n=1 Tax=unclassified Streptomyces TaxID=2593676 RepID=UPI00340D8A47